MGAPFGVLQQKWPTVVRYRPSGEIAQVAIPRESPEDTRYSPARITKSDKVTRFGSPDMEHVSTSYAEHLNLSVRMHNRRFARLTNAHSKSAAHHEAMINIFVAWYNFCRRNQALKKQTPAMSSGLTDKIWSIEDLLRSAANVSFSRAGQMR